MQFDFEFDTMTTRHRYRKEIPKDTCGVYFLANKDMKLLYIGRAKNIISRISTHKGPQCHITDPNIKPLFDTFYFIGIKFYPNQWKAKQIEEALIELIKPPCNTIGVTIGVM